MQREGFLKKSSFNRMRVGLLKLKRQKKRSGSTQQLLRKLSCSGSCEKRINVTWLASSHSKEGSFRLYRDRAKLTSIGMSHYITQRTFADSPPSLCCTLQICL